MNNFTEEQRAAIDARGKTIVSASAGSGKTTVMIEKIVRLIISGTDVKEILAVTFTKKAAAQMKEKLRKELIKAINSPETSPAVRAALKKQLAEVPSADISTIHSFCSKLIRSHFFAAGVDSDFSVIAEDDADGTKLKNDALDEVFEEAYEKGEENFLRLLSVYWRKKSDNRLRGILFDTYSALRMRADYRTFLTENAAFTEEKFNLIVERLFSKLKEKCMYYASRAEREKTYFEDIGREKSKNNAEEVLSALSALLSASDYFLACALPCPGFSAKERAKKDDTEEISSHIAALAEIRDKVKGIFSENAEVLSREEELAAYLSSGKIAESLTEYLLRFDEKYGELKRERGLLDYNDLEHIALELLSVPAVAEEIKQKYRHVFVDEYQDVNPVQERILSAVGGENVFLVGDIKQSIYGFRGSKSVFFAEKQSRFEAEEGASSLYLTRNFRSADAVLEAVNAQFLLAMTKENSDVDYAGGSFMERGGRYASGSGRVQIHILSKEKEKKEQEKRGIYSVEAGYLKERAKASAYAKQIRHIIESERNARWFDADEGVFKRVEYSDIAVLSRKKNGRITEVISALSEEGIPVTASAAVNICDYPEVKALYDILSLIDNAEQDIPLCSALLSSMGDLIAEDLSKIRLAYPEERFFRNCCKKYSAEKGDIVAHKLNKFYAYLAALRRLAAVADAGEILSKILSDTHMEARLLSRDNGVGCLKRIHRFIEETLNPEPLSVHEFLDRLRALGNCIEYSENGGENAVRVLTMHASKGLEYPVVILDDLSASFHGADRDEVLLDEEFALAPKCYRKENMTVSGTLLRKLAEKRGQEDSIKDELNLFYVAMTRAKYSLHMLFTGRSPTPDVRYAKSFADFVDFSVWEKYISDEKPFELPYQERTALVSRPDEELSEEIVRAFSWKYPFSDETDIPVKSSATALLESSDTEKPREYAREYFSVPVLFEEDEGGKGDSWRLSGIAYHAFLEHFDFSLLYGTSATTSEIAERELARMKEKKLLAVEQIALLRKEKISEILSNPVFSSLSDMKLYREQKFLVSMPAREVLKEKISDDCGEEILFQGAIDLLAVSTSGEARIVDYKYSTKDAETLRTHYAPQLKLYKKAVSKILRIAPEKIRCSFVNIYRGFETEAD